MGVKTLRKPTYFINLHKSFLNEKNLILDKLESQILKPEEHDPVEIFTEVMEKLRVIERTTN